jgi:hypothetical protein
MTNEKPTIKNTYVEKSKLRKKESSFRLSEGLREKLYFVVKLTGLSRNKIIENGLEEEINKLLRLYKVTYEDVKQELDENKQKEKLIYERLKKPNLNQG